MSTPFPSEPVIHRWASPGQPPLFFLHANSYAAELYHDFLQPLFPQFDIYAPDLPGHGRSRWNGLIHNWQEVADFYIRYFDQYPPEAPMVGMGHSIGGIVIMLMSIQRPEWFKSLILLDPVMLPKGILLMIRGLKLFSLTHHIPLVKATRRRRTQFPDTESAVKHFSAKKVFSHLEPAFLRSYVETCLFENSTGSWQLACSPELEASIYQSFPLHTWSLPRRLVHPSLFIIGDHSDTINNRGARRLAGMGGNHIVKGIDGGHLFPFEKPTETIELIRDYLR